MWISGSFPEITQMLAQNNKRCYLWTFDGAQWFSFLFFTQIKIEGELIKIITMIMVMIFIMMIISIKWNEIFLPACFHFCISLDAAKLNYFLQMFRHYFPFCHNLFIWLFINTPCRATFRQTHFWYLIYSPNIKKSIEYNEDLTRFWS